MTPPPPHADVAEATLPLSDVFSDDDVDIFSEGSLVQGGRDPRCVHALFHKDDEDDMEDAWKLLYFFFFL